MAGNPKLPPMTNQAGNRVNQAVYSDAAAALGRGCAWWTGNLIAWGVAAAC